MDIEAIEMKVLKIINNHHSDYLGRLAVMTDTKETLELDSLDEIELVMATEDFFDIELPDEELEKVETVANFVSLISEYI